MNIADIEALTDPTVDLLEGIAGLIVAAGLGVYRPVGADEPYAETEVGITLNDMPPEPDWIICLSDYQVAADPYPTSFGTIGVQIRTRAAGPDPRNEKRLRGALFQLLHGTTDRWFGSCHLVQLLYKTTVPLNEDDSNRWEYSTNYYADVDFPPTPNRPD